jgi:formylmethanofuran dehydrogenase subunit D
MSFVFISGRSTNQGRYINIGKDTDEYRAMVRVLSMNGKDLAQLGLHPGMQVCVRSECGESTFQCAEGELPQGIVFALYGPPTCALISGQTDGTGMPAQKGFEVEIEVVGQSADMQSKTKEEKSVHD